MRILFANDGIGDAGGVQSYLSAVMNALQQRGHEIAFVHLDPLRDGAPSPADSAAEHFCVAQPDRDRALAAAAAWNPAVCFSHNMRDLQVERGLLGRFPVVKMMHGYFGTCVGGQKIHAFPRTVACHRRFGVACAVLYLPRHCGQSSLRRLGEQYAWASDQQALFGRYRAITVASRHMYDEYARNGVESSRLVINPLFAASVPARASPPPGEFRVLFVGRMTDLKGGDMLIRAVSHAITSAGAAIAVTLAGDGPSRPAWERFSRALGVRATFTGWVGPEARDALYRAASVVAVPSLWPEPFGLVGLEAGAHGVPALAFDIGGIGEWLCDGVNGWLVPPEGGPAALGDALARIHGGRADLGAMRAGARAAAEKLSLGRHVAALEDLLACAAPRGAAL